MTLVNIDHLFRKFLNNSVGGNKIWGCTFASEVLYQKLEVIFVGDEAIIILIHTFKDGLDMSLIGFIIDKRKRIDNSL